jgi:hypothetical protein
MMLPSLLLVGAGSRRRIWIPLPVILLWPFWLLGWVLWLPARLLSVRWGHAMRHGLVLLARLSGLRMDVDTADGKRIHVRFV